MKNLRNLMAAITLMVVLVVGANAGVLLGDRSATCDTKQDVSITASDIVGIIVAGFTGIIVAGREGIIVAGRDGIIVAGKSTTGCQEQSRDGILLSD